MNQLQRNQTGRLGATQLHCKTGSRLPRTAVADFPVQSVVNLHHSFEWQQAAVPNCPADSEVEWGLGLGRGQQQGPWMGLI